MPLDVASVAGGALRKHLAQILDDNRAAWFLPSHFLLRDRHSNDRPVERSIRKEEVLKWIGRNPQVKLFSDDPHSMKKALGLEFITYTESVPDAREWACEIFPRLTASAGDLWVRKWLTRFSKELGQPIHYPWEDLRFFPGFLRQQNDLASAFLAAREWAYFQALYSPHDEKEEARSLDFDQLALNPTVQALRENEKLALTFRSDDIVHELDIGWREALLIDEIGEQARQSYSEFLSKTENEARGMSLTLDRDSQSRGATNFSDALATLIKRGVILRGE